MIKKPWFLGQGSCCIFFLASASGRWLFCSCEKSHQKATPKNGAKYYPIALDYTLVIFYTLSGFRRGTFLYRESKLPKRMRQRRGFFTDGHDIKRHLNGRKTYHGRLFAHQVRLPLQRRGLRASSYVIENLFQLRPLFGISSPNIIVSAL